MREDQLEEYAQVLRLLFDLPFADLTGVQYALDHAPNFPKPLRVRLPVWLGGGGEKRTLRTAARHADGWNVPDISPAEWAAKSAVLDRWCERERRDPRAARQPPRRRRAHCGVPGCGRRAARIILRAGPYDWDALAAFAGEVVPQFARKP